MPKTITYLLSYDLHHDTSVVQIVNQLPRGWVEAELLAVVEVRVGCQANFLRTDILESEKVRIEISAIDESSPFHPNTLDICSGHPKNDIFK